MSEHHHHHQEHDHHHHDHGSAEEMLALLKYMTDHNRHHAEELHELAHGLDAEAAELIHQAVADYEAGNEKLVKALELLKENV